MRITKNDRNENVLNDYNYKDSNKNQAIDILYMLDRTSVMFDWDGLPDTIPEKELEKLLQTNGYAIICKIDGKLYATGGGLGGMLDVYNRPTKATVSIPYLNYNATLEIDKECFVIRNDTYQLGLIPLFSKYISLLNENNISLNIGLLLSRANKVFSCNDSNTKESIDNYIKNLETGKLSTIMDRDVMDSLKIESNKEKENLMQHIEINQYFKGQLFNEIGLASNFNMKKERLISSEVENTSNNIYPLLDDMYVERYQALEKFKSVLGFENDITIAFNSSWRNRVDNNNPLDDPQDTPQDDPKGVNDDQKGIQDDPKGINDDQKGIQDDPKGINDDQKGIQDDPKGIQDDPKGINDDPTGAQDDND